MQKRILKRLAVMALCSIVPVTAHALTQYAMRPQSSNTAREISGVEHFIFPYRPDECDRYDVMWVTYAYDRSRKSDEISRCLFGNALDTNTNCDTQNILVQGSQVQNRSSRAWLADYFGLSTNFSSRVEIDPRITNNIVEFNYYSDLSQWCEGMWFRAHLPVVHTKWQLRYNETVVSAGTNGYDAGYFTDGPVPRHALLNSFLEYAVGGAPLLAAGLTIEPGDVTSSERLVRYEPLACSKWANECCDLPDETKLSDIYVMLGYDWWENECGHLGVGILGTFPTGNRPTGEFFFEPIVGTGHHWGLGVVVNGSRNFWEAECSDRALDFFFELQVLHLFKDKQCVVFDLVNGCNSRYMLASRFRTDAEDLFYTEDANSINGDRAQMMRQFNYVYTPVANLTKTKLNVSYGAMYDFTALLSYTNECGNMFWDIGYNLWGRSCTKFSKLNDCDTSCASRLSRESWALKGDATMFGYSNFNIVGDAVCGQGVCNNGDNVVNAAVVALSATESCATIANGTNNYPNGINNVPARANPGIDSPAFAIGLVEDGFEILYDRPDSTDNQVRTSSSPQLLSIESLDVCAARQKGLSNTVFGNVTYTWDECGCGEPFVNFGARVEFGSNSDDCKDLCNQNKACTSQQTTTCQTSCDSNDSNSCVKCSLSQWGIWLRGGVVFG